jgi:hypothetical protein
MQRTLRAVRVSASILAAALCASAAGAGPVFIKMEGIDVPGEQIEIQSFSWGTSPPGAAAHVGGGHGTGKVQVHDISMSRVTDGPASSDIAMKGSKIHQNAPRGTGANQMSMDDTAGRERSGTAIGKAIGGHANDGEQASGRPVGASEKLTVGGGRTETGQATGRRQYRPIMIAKEAGAPTPATRRPPKLTARRGLDGSAGGDPDRPIVAGTVPAAGTPKLAEHAINGNSLGAPPAKGSVWIRVATPWTRCRAGAHYPRIELGDGSARYELSNVVVTRCEPGGASLDYAKVTVRGWDPSKKEE